MGSKFQFENICSKNGRRKHPITSYYSLLLCTEVYANIPMLVIRVFVAFHRLAR